MDTKKDLFEILNLVLLSDVVDEEPPSPVMWRLRGYGNQGFDLIKERLVSGTLAPEGVVRGLRCLSYLARDVSGLRESELLDLSLAFIESDDLSVRSGATNVAIWTCRILESIPTRLRDVEKIRPAPVRVEVEAKVRQALLKGLDGEQTGLAERFLIGIGEV